ncbi:NUDIX hydrolase [Tropicimonas sp. S265A]|uniref:NUDIX hydrolase n=1 Tax=Tropicimonas sp. S265A TaxID=3415134 RepID=UPI003C7A2DCA
MDKTAIRHAATVIVVRDAHAKTPSVLMGQRGAKAAFMPSKYVFPGGAVDPDDAIALQVDEMAPSCRTKLGHDARGTSAAAVAGAAIRELWEETGLRLGINAPASDKPELSESWQSFFASGAQPAPSALRYVFRAITPPGRPRRFDARFLLTTADALMDDPDDFSKASDELSHLHWVPLAEARALNLPFITEVVLGEVAGALPDLAAPEGVPFFQHDDTLSKFARL